ncbi:P-loop NTPase fold protein [Microbulbifer variabilis]|uniref:KAP family P-loop NTPase fold protein n=1 Tax=Microbulbifer variabilis TaxID=266805 RepID=UPI001CFD8A5D|nr:P-loop NTPase fold protein [Microbulbifer variabilis]
MSESDAAEQVTNNVPFRIKEIDTSKEAWPPLSDRLRRCDEVENLTPLLETVEAPLVFAIDSPWGGGKTTFIELWQKYLKEKTNSKTCLYLNAWENDFAEDPLLPLLSCFDDWLSKEKDDSIAKALNNLKKLSPAIIKGGVSVISKLATLGTLDLSKEYEKVIADAVGGSVETLVDQFQSQKNSLKYFKENLQTVVSILPEGQQNLIIFIDELDRCRPTFAIELLERIKHLFDLERVVFVVAVNREQLGKSIKCVYGNDFDGHAYLDRFFDLEYQLSDPDRHEYIKAASIKSGLHKHLSTRKHIINSDYLQILLVWLCSHYSLTLRDINRIVSRLTLIIKSTVQDTHIHLEALTLLLFLRNKDEDHYNQFINGTCSANDIVKHLLLDEPSRLEKLKEPQIMTLVIGRLLALEENEAIFKQSIAHWEAEHKTYEGDTQMQRYISSILKHTKNSYDQRIPENIINMMAKKVELLQKIEVN